MKESMPATVAYRLPRGGDARLEGPADIERLTLSNWRSYRADRYGGVELKVQKPNMPQGMSKRSKAIWRTLTELLNENELIANLDGLALQFIRSIAA